MHTEKNKPTIQVLATFLFFLLISTHSIAQEILNTSKFRDHQEHYIAKLSGSLDIYIDHESGAEVLVNQLELPIENVVQAQVSNRYHLQSGVTKHYVLLNQANGKLSVFSVENIMEQSKLNFISSFDDHQVSEVQLDNAPEEDENFVSIHNVVTLTFADGGSSELTLREVLKEAFANRAKAMAVQQKEDEQKVDEYLDSWTYTGARNYGRADGFFRGFIPVDDDIVPKGFNYVVGTNAKQMVVEDLIERGLLFKTSKEQRRQIVTDLAYDKHYSQIGGSTVLVGGFAFAKGRSAYRAYKASQASQVTRVATGVEVAAVTSSKAGIYANRHPVIQVASNARDLFTKGFNRKTWDIYRKDVIVGTNLTLAAGIGIDQTKKFGPNPKDWAGYSIATDFVLINSLTYIIMGVIACKVNYGYKMFAIAASLDVIDPSLQFIEHKLDGDNVEFFRDVVDVPNLDLRPLEPSRQVFDKLFIGVFALPKSNFMNYYVNPKVQAAVAPTFPRIATILGKGVVVTNEVAGNTLYRVQRDSAAGIPFIDHYLTPILEFDQLDIEQMIEEGRVQLVPIEQMPVELQSQLLHQPMVPANSETDE